MLKTKGHKKIVEWLKKIIEFFYKSVHFYLTLIVLRNHQLHEKL